MLTETPGSKERTMIDSYDPEATIQEADILQAQYEREGRALAADKRAGICNHGWQLGRRVPAFYSAKDVWEMHVESGDFPDRTMDTVEQDAIPVGKSLCLDCGKLVADRLA